MASSNPKKQISKSRKMNKHLFPVVAIGASAGGLEAFEAFFQIFLPRLEWLMLFSLILIATISA